jgi:hypothetical protein
VKRELHERQINGNITFARLVEQTDSRACARRSREQERIDRIVALGRELDVGQTEGADHAVFRRGAGVDGQPQPRTGREVIIVTIALAEIAKPRRLIVDAAVERGVYAQEAAELDAGVGARNIEETLAVRRADPHIFDRAGLERKISRLCPACGKT